MIEMAKDYYQVLGVSKDATAEQIKDAYRALAMKYHPDKNKDKNAEEKFKEINEAYAVLGDPEKRKQYESFGPEGFKQRYTEDDIFRGFNFEDIIREFQDNMFAGGFAAGGNPFGGDIFGQQQQEQTGVQVPLTFAEIEKGVTKEFQVERYKTCDHCNGSGGEPGSKQIKCPTCNGKGRMQIHQNTPFGVFNMVTTCNRCGGRGKIYDKLCRICKGNGRVVVTEKFRVTAESTSKPNPEKKDEKPKGKGFFGIF
jgi:molecular chaperone DnaJ